MMRTRVNYFIVIWLYVLLIAVTIGGGKRVPLLDTTGLSGLHWTTHSASESAEDGWLEESYTNPQEGTNSRAYVVCDVRRENVDNWVRTPFIKRGEARRLSVEMTFTMRDCKLFPHTARTCKETFTLMAYEADLDFATNDLPDWSDRQSAASGAGYKRIDRITADNGRFTRKSDILANTQTRIVPVSKTGVYFAFRDEGACISLLSVKVYYEVCEEVVTNFAWFPETAVGANLTSIQETLGHCVDNASPPSPGAQPKYVCKADGTWDLLSGGCQCNPGHRPDGSRCLACAPGFYKDTPGLAGCMPCPANSVSKTPGAPFCACEAGYYRAPTDSKSSPCTRPPSRPIDLKVVKVETSRAVLSWKQPEDLGGRPTVWYSVECPECPSDAQYLPAKKMFNTTTLTLTNLALGSLYTVFVYAENEITPQVDSLPMYAVADFTTQTLPSAASGIYVADLRVDAVTSNELNASWTVPVSAYASEIVKLKSSGSYESAAADLVESSSSNQQYFHYAVRLFVKDPNTQKRKLVPPSAYRANGGNNETAATNVPKFTFYDLRASSEYGYQVQVVGPNGETGAWSDIRWTRTSASGENGANNELHKREDVQSEPVANYVLPIVGIVALLAAGVFVAVCVLRRYQKPNMCSGEKQSSDLDALEDKSDPLRIGNHHRLHSDSIIEYNSAATLSRKMVTPLVPSFAAPTSPFHNKGFKQYVDPLAYEDPNQALQEFTNEVDRSRVRIEDTIGKGEFGEVCKGTIYQLQSGREETVAIKTLKPGSSDKAKDFLAEASIMGQFDHPNVIKLKGVVTKGETIMIITEFMENGSLDKFLRINDGRLDAIQLVTMLSGIANGMKYLSDMGFVHRDLAARNVLVDASISCKIADFGLSRGTEGSIEQVYTTKGGKIPVRWTAPEAIAYRKFTTKSDVWSFGVLMWEVMSYGERPYWNWTNQQVVQAIEQHDFRLPPPMDCPKALHQLMLQCWQKEREQRPTFGKMLELLQGFLQCPELLYTTSAASSISTPLGISHSGGSFASLTSYTVLPSLRGAIGTGTGGDGHPSTGGTSSGFVSAAASGAYQATSSPLPNPTTSPLTNCHHITTTLERFLRDIGLERCAPTLYRHGCRNVHDLARLTSVDTALLGLQPFEHSKITDALHRLHVSSAAYYPPQQSHSPKTPHHVVPCRDSSSNDGFFV